MWGVKDTGLGWSPHSSGLDNLEDERICDIFCANLRRYLDGEPMKNVIDPALGY